SAQIRKLLVCSGLAALGLAAMALAVGSTAAAATQDDETTWSSRHDGPAADCSDMDVRFDHERAIVKSEEKTVTKAEAPTLRVHADTNGGVQLQGWDKDAYSVTTCKFAEPPQGEGDG